MGAAEDQEGPADYETKGGRLPHGTKLRGRYSGAEFQAEIRDGEVVMNGETYTSLSAASVAAKRSTGANVATTNGWRFWERKDPRDGKWKPCREVRGVDSE